MAERSPPDLLGNKNHSPPSVLLAIPEYPQFPPLTLPPSTSRQLVISQPQNPSVATFRSGTYVVQVPKDQIYHVPPPENAYIVERHQDPSRKRKRPLCCNLYCIGILAFIVLLVVMLVTIFSVMFAKSENPKFSVERVVVHSKSNGRPDYSLTLRVRNPNSRVAIVYNGGGTSLHFKQKTIANGKYPSLTQGTGKSKEVTIVVHGANVILPKEIKKSLGVSESSSSTKKVQVSLSLNMNIPARLRIGTLKSRSMKFHATCDITVDELSKRTKVLKQECETQRK
ncbi:hypothetical protein EV2_020182 [Malus domestica]